MAQQVASDQSQTEAQSQQPQTQVFERRLVVEVHNGSTGSPKLHRRTVDVRFVTEPAIGEWEFRRRLLKELEAVRGVLRSQLGPYFEEGDFIVQTRLERMLELALGNILRPHSTRTVELKWRVSWEDEPRIREAAVSVDFNGYDPPLTVHVSVCDGLSVKVEFSGKWESTYRRSVCESTYRPIDILAIALALRALSIVDKALKGWFLLGDDKCAVLRLEGDSYVVCTRYDPALLEQQTEQEQQEQQTEQAQEGQAVPEQGQGEAQEGQQ